MQAPDPTIRPRQLAEGSSGPKVDPQARYGELVRVTETTAHQLNAGGAILPLTQVVDFLESVDRCRDSFHSRLELKS